MIRNMIVGAVLLGSAGLASAGAETLFEEKAKDFGTTPRGGVLVHYFRFTNTTTQTLSLGTPRVSCGCVSAHALHQQVEPGRSSAIVAYMDTRRIPTPNTLRQVTVYVPFLAPTQEEVSLKVQTVCRDDLMFAPDVIAFGSVGKGAGAKAATKVTLTSDPNWQVTEAASSGGYVKVETKPVSRQGSQVTYEVTATLDPACPVGTWTADVTLKTTGAGVESLRIPVTVTVAAPAVKPEAVAANPAKPEVVAAPTLIATEKVNLGEIAVGSPVQHQVVLKASQPFKVLAVKGMDGELTVKTDAAGEAKAVHVILFNATPKAAGAFARTVEIETDSKEAPKIGVAISAQVVGK